MSFAKFKFFFAVGIFGALAISGCTLKAVGDPKRPITINAHITVDIKGLKNTATDVEDYVRGEKTGENFKAE